MIEVYEVIFCEGLCRKESLYQIAAVVIQEVPLLHVLYTLCYHCHPEHLCHVDHVCEYNLFPWITASMGYEALVELYDVCLIIYEKLEVCVSGAEIIYQEEAGRKRS